MLTIKALFQKKGPKKSKEYLNFTVGKKRMKRNGTLIRDGHEKIRKMSLERNLTYNLVLSELKNLFKADSNTEACNGSVRIVKVHIQTEFSG